MALRGLCLKTDLIPFALRRHFRRHGDGRFAGTGIACRAAAATGAYNARTFVVVVIAPTRRIGDGLSVVEVLIIQDAFCTVHSPSSTTGLAALAARSSDNVVTRTCPVKVAGGPAATAAAAGATVADARGCTAVAASTAATAAGSTIVESHVVVQYALAGTAAYAAHACHAARGRQVEGGLYIETAHRSGGLTGFATDTITAISRFIR